MTLNQPTFLRPPASKKLKESQSYKITIENVKVETNRTDDTKSVINNLIQMARLSRTLTLICTKRFQKFYCSLEEKKK